jgi:transcription initiation factor TFIID TATA-box-binding protein
MTSDLCQRINFLELKKYSNIIHDASIYGGKVAYFKSPEMTGRVTGFPSGKLISVGTKNEKDAINELNFLKNFLVNKGSIKEVNLQFKVQNIVAVTSIGKINNFEKIVDSFDMVYEPEQFSGAIYKPLNMGVTVLLFPSGKMVIVGLKSEKQVKKVVKELTFK